MSNDLRYCLLSQLETVDETDEESDDMIGRSMIKVQPRIFDKTSFIEYNDNKKPKNPKKYSAKKEVFNRTGYTVSVKIAYTKQGSVYHAKRANGDKCAVKRASAAATDNGILQENIKQEAPIMKYLTVKGSKSRQSKYMVKYLDSFYDGTNYFMLIEYGGKRLFNHVKTMHDNIKKGELSIKKWKEHVKILGKQMCDFVLWMHDMNIAHLDISLENILLKDCVYNNGEFSNHGTIKFIDFGLSELITNDNYKKCQKYVGKKHYKCPEIYDKTPYNIRKADVWSLGCVLYIMMFGSMPYVKPIETDLNFKMIINQNIRVWARNVGKRKYVIRPVLKLLYKMLRYEQDRWTMKQLFDKGMF